MRSYLTNHDIIAVSALNKEIAINTPRDPDMALLVSKSDMFSYDFRTENNAEELTGKEEADKVYRTGATVSTSFNFEKAQPNHIAFLLAYALGVCTTTAAGTTGKLHTITPIDGDVAADRSLPSFTATQRWGKTVLKERYASCFVDQATLTFSKDAFVKATGSIKATGKVDRNIETETVSVLNDAAEITLAANGVQGSTAQERLDNVHSIQAELTEGVWTDVAYSAVSDATPAVITITALGGDGGSNVNVKVIYIPTESESWMTFPSMVQETPLRVSQATCVLGGAWDGSDFQGGRTMAGELSNVEWSVSNNLDVSFTFGGAGDYASRALRGGRTQTLKLDRDFKDYILSQYQNSEEYFGFRVLCTGAEIEDGHNYQVEIILPRVAVLSTSRSDNSNRLSESVEFAVLEDDTYGSVIINVKNKVAGYAA
ncbi:hypothetical protein DENIS_3459 [Desulfonema ishimotonii]|uniref:Uncharacterized protein n=1 Tax=Desulfonema ishimotonii TaxID=45657 RepID=A0A401FZW8_9BACT|nr:phage tail tube protein [Desulfonema ishimotonii]GBC62487.1 hypothetical protein DENIS_3459 [Desulfonema ishimotonii]